MSSRDETRPSADSLCIDPFDDAVKLLTKEQVVAFLRKKLGIKIHPGTATRWFLTGSGGRKLPSVKVCGVRYTTEECVKRFILATQPENKPATGSQRDKTLKTVKPKAAKTRTQRAKRARKRLAKSGI